MRSWLSVLAEPFEPVTLAEVDAAAALRDRVDVKYLAPAPAVVALAERLRDTHGVLQIDGHRVFTYETTYFDSPSLLTYREHVQGRRRRFKCRSRRYVETGACVFEVKLKGARERTVKRRMAYASDLCRELAPHAEDFLRVTLAEHYGREPGEPFVPALHMTYRRLTLVDPAAGERLTCDVELRFDGGGGLCDGWAILESKSERGRGRAERLLSELGIRPASRCSKYCVGTTLRRPDLPSNPFRPVLRQAFETRSRPMRSLL